MIFLSLKLRKKRASGGLTQDWATPTMKRGKLFEILKCRKRTEVKLMAGSHMLMEHGCNKAPANLSIFFLESHVETKFQLAEETNSTSFSFWDHNLFHI